MGGRGKYSRSGPRQSLFPANHDAPSASLPLPTYPFRHALALPSLCAPAPKRCSSGRSPTPKASVGYGCRPLVAVIIITYCRLCSACSTRLRVVLLLSSPGHLPPRVVVVSSLSLHTHTRTCYLRTHIRLRSSSLPHPRTTHTRTHGRRDARRRRAGARSVSQPLAWLSALECPMSQWTGATGRF